MMYKHLSQLLTLFGFPLDVTISIPVVITHKIVYLYHKYIKMVNLVYWYFKVYTYFTDSV